MWNRLKRAIGKRLAVYLNSTSTSYHSFSAYESPGLKQFLEPGDILLVEGNSRVSTAIKYLTQSTWSHAAFFAGDATNRFTDNGEPCPLIEAELDKGVIASPLSRYYKHNTRICRPVNLLNADRTRLVDQMVSALGKEYDLKHIFDLARYLFPTPPVPVRFRRRLLALGSGDPSRAICSTLIAESYQSIHYPILPTVETDPNNKQWQHIEQEILHIRHHSLFTPRDFDISPFFRIVKPTVEKGFDYRALDLRLDESPKPSLPGNELA